VRYNENGELRVPWGYVGALQFEPISKTPFLHALPGRYVLSFGMLGCNLRCAYCQNWEISQTLRDKAAATSFTPLSPDRIVEIALARNVGAIASSLNEPLITAEWAVAIFRSAKQAGLVTAFLSSGDATDEVLDYVRPYVDLFKIDLKAMSADHYRALGAKHENVLRTIEKVHERGFWMEIVTLLVPGWNTSDDEIRAAARFIASVSPDIPWILWNFHRDYRMRDRENATAAHIKRAAQIGRDEGLRFVYGGVMPGLLGDLENTRCPDCSYLLVERVGYLVTGYHIRNGCCPGCGVRIPGRWPSDPKTVAVGYPGLWFEHRAHRIF
jgi:pyruvate formate lyase activating enzyme